jgi:Calx-beta domain
MKTTAIPEGSFLKRLLDPIRLRACLKPKWVAFQFRASLDRMSAPVTLRLLLLVLALLGLSSRNVAQSDGTDPRDATNVVGLEVPGTAFLEILGSDLLIRGQIVLPEPAQPVSAEWSSSTGAGGPVTYGADNRFELSVTNLPRGKVTITILVTATDERVYHGLVIGLKGDFFAPVVTVDSPAWLATAFTGGRSVFRPDTNRVTLSGSITDQTPGATLRFTEVLLPDKSGTPGSDTSVQLRSEDVSVGPDSRFVIADMDLPTGREIELILNATDVAGNVAILNARIAGEGSTNPPIGGFLSIPDVVQTRDEGTPPVWISFKVDPPNPSAETRVRFQVVGGTATAGLDYRIETNVVVLAPGEYFSAFRFELIDDAEIEPEETILFEASIEGADSANAPVAVEIRIEDNESSGAAQFIASSFVANEAAGEAALRLYRRGNTAVEGSVAYRVEGDEALVNFLGTARTGVAQFGRGESQTAIRLPLLNDDQVQGLRKLLVSLSDPQGGLTLGAITNGTLLVRDDESPPSAEPQSVERYDFDARFGLYVTFNTVRGFRYVIEYANAPAAESWTVLTTLDGNNSQQSTWDSTEESATRFYRYRVENEPLTMPGD